MKKDFKTSALIILVVIITLAVFDNLKMADKVNGLQEVKQELSNQNKSLEENLENRSNTLGELEKENKQLAEELYKSEEALKTFIDYQEFLDAISTIESYKKAQTFEETKKFIALKNGVGFSVQDSSYKCPCFFILNNREFEWIPNAVLELKKFRIENEKIILTYSAVEDIGNNYQFVMTKAIGLEDSAEKWRIEEINLQEK